MIQSPAGYQGDVRIKRYLDFYQAGYGVAMLSSGVAFSPLSLFANGEQGGWYDPSDLTTLYQDAAGTTPVTAVEQPVGLVLDKSRGLVASTKGGQITGVSGSGFDTPSAAANQITSDIDIRVQASMVSWASANTVFCSRIFTGVTTADAYEFWISSTGVLRLLLVSGTTATDVSSSVSVGFAAGTTNWVRVTWQQSTGYVNFYTSSDGVTWTQNGAANRAGQTSAINAGTRFLRIGARTEGNFTLNGKIYRAQIYNGINGTLAVDFNPTLYTGGATFTAATSEVWTIAGTARIVPDGSHLSQSTAAARPVLSSRVNLLTYTEQFDNAAWTKSGTTASGKKVTAQAGTGVAAYIETGVTNAPAASITLSCIFPATTGRHRYVWMGDRGVAPIASATFDLNAVSVVGKETSATATAVTLSDGSVRCTLTYTRASVGTSGINIALAGSTYTADRPTGTWTGSEFLDMTADLRVTNDGVGLPAYQRVGAATDYDTAGFPLYLKFDGTDDFLQSSTITPGSVDKAQVFAGVRKLNDTTGGVVAETSTGTAQGRVYIYAGGKSTATGARWTFGSAGTATGDAETDTSFAAPRTDVLTGLGDISGDTSTLRINGAQVVQSTSDQGTGNYGSQPLYVGRRGGTTLPASMNLYSLILRFSAANLDAATITATETWVNQRTKAF